MTGTRFADTVDLFDDTDSESFYTPRHLRAVTLSPDLQRALDKAFSRDPEPEPLPTLEPEPALPAEPVADPEPVAPARAQLALVIPETITYTVVATDPASVEAELAAVAPEPEPVVASMPVPEPVPAHAVVGAFPDPSAYAARRVAGGTVPPPPPSVPAAPAAVVARGSMFRFKVDPSRLMVPSAG